MKCKVAVFQKLCFFLWLTIGITTHAQQIYFAIPNGSTTADGLSWTNAVNLETALSLAQNNDEIWVQEGTHLVSNTFVVAANNVTLLGGFNGTETASMQRDWQNNVTILDGNLSSRIMTISASNAVVDGFTFTNGNLTGPGEEGAGILASSLQGTLNIKNCIFDDNYSFTGGAGVRIKNSTAVITNCNFINNITATNGGGARITSSSVDIIDCFFDSNESYNYGGAVSASLGDITFTNTDFFANICGINGGAISSSIVDLDFNDCIFNNNHADEDGGAFSLSSSSSLVFNSCNFINNTADLDGGAGRLIGSNAIFESCFFNTNLSVGKGGAVYCQAGTASFITSTFNENYSTSSQGGALSSLSTPFTIHSCEFSYNSAFTFGGAIDFFASQIIDIYNSSFTNNTAASGAGAINLTGSSGYGKINRTIFSGNNSVTAGAIDNDLQQLDISNVLFANNSASSLGGAIVNSDKLFLTNVTFANNSSTALALGGNNTETKVYNSIFYGNTATSNYANAHPDIDGAFSQTTFSSSQLIMKNNILEVAPTDGLSQNNLIGVDPLFVNALSGDYTLSVGSPAADVGDNALYLEVTGTNAANDIDLNGNIRLYNAIIDMGAYELFDEPLYPDCTTMVLPTNGQIDVSIDTNIEWLAANAATGYTIYIGTTAGGSEVLTEDVGNVLVFDIPTSLDYNTTYYVRIVPYNNFGDAIDCSEFSFTTEEEPIIYPDCTTLITPSDGQQNVSISTIIEWQQAANATGYLLEIGTSSGANDVFSQDVGNVLTYNLPSNLNYNTTYYIRIIPYNDNGPASNCSEFTFTTEQEPLDLPNCTSILVPTDGQQNVSINTVIEWQAVSNTTGYIVEIGTSSGANDVLSQDVGNILMFNLPSSLNYNTTYYVRIIPYNDDGQAINCAEYTFKTELEPIVLPGCTSLLIPTDGQVNVSINTSIQWTAATDATGYIVQVGTSPGASDILSYDTGVVLSYTFSTPLEYLTTYYVRVIPYNDDGQMLDCSEFSFTTQRPPAPIPDCTSLLVPSNGQINVSVYTSIAWLESELATAYILEIGTTSGGSEVLSEDVGNVLSYTPSIAFEANTTYFVRIIPYNESGQLNNCEEFSFTTAEVSCDFNSYVEVNLNTVTVFVVPSSADFEYRIDNGPWQSSNVFYGLEDGNHLIEIRNEFGCIQAHAIVINLNNDYNFISPNGDGYNDTLDYSYLMEKENASLLIANRYGKVVFEGNPSNQYIWNGRSHGLTLPSTTYWVFIQWTENGITTKTSHYVVLKNDANARYE